MNNLIRTAIEQIKANGYIPGDTLKHMTVEQMLYAHEQAVREGDGVTRAGTEDIK